MKLVLDDQFRWRTKGSIRPWEGAREERIDLDSFVYLHDLFLRIPTHPNKEIHLLLHDNWKRQILPTLDAPPRL